MARINLLPWREELRQQRKKEFGAAIALALLVTGGVWFGYYSYINQRIAYQDTRNGFLEGQIALLDRKIEEIRKLEAEKESLIQRMRAIETLQTSRPVIVKLFNALVTTLPEGLFLTSVEQKGEKLTLRGVAQSNARVSNFMRKIDASDVLKSPQLTVIETRMEDGRRLSNFTLVASQIAASEEGEEELQ